MDLEIEDRLQEIYKFIKNRTSRNNIRKQNYIYVWCYIDIRRKYKYNRRYNR